MAKEALDRHNLIIVMILNGGAATATLANNLITSKINTVRTQNTGQNFLAIFFVPSQYNHFQNQVSTFLSDAYK